MVERLDAVLLLKVQNANFMILLVNKSDSVEERCIMALTTSICPYVCLRYLLFERLLWCCSVEGNSWCVITLQGQQIRYISTSCLCVKGQKCAKYIYVMSIIRLLYRHGSCVTIQCSVHSDCPAMSCRTLNFSNNKQICSKLLTWSYVAYSHYRNADFEQKTILGEQLEICVRKF